MLIKFGYSLNASYRLGEGMTMKEYLGCSHAYRAARHEAFPRILESPAKMVLIMRNVPSKAMIEV